MNKRIKAATTVASWPNRARYAGTGTEVVDALTPAIAASLGAQRLLDVAAWHDKRYAARNAAIASRLRQLAANDNGVRVTA